MTRNWNRDGWAEKDWYSITTRCADLIATARELDDAVGGGGGGFEPTELAEFAERLRAIADRLGRVAGDYV